MTGLQCCKKSASYHKGPVGVGVKRCCLLNSLEDMHLGDEATSWMLKDGVFFCNRGGEARVN